MADEVRGTVSGGNGERLDLRIGGQALGFTTKDLVNVLIVLVLGGFGYFLAYNVTNNQQRGFAGLSKVLEQGATHQTQVLDKFSVVLERFATNQAALLTHVQQNREHMSSEMRAQSTLLFQQTEALRIMFDEQTTLMRKMLVTINYNLNHEPHERIPLEFTPSEMPQRARPH